MLLDSLDDEDNDDDLDNEDHREDDDNAAVLEEQASAFDQKDDSVQTTYSDFFFHRNPRLNASQTTKDSVVWSDPCTGTTWLETLRASKHNWTTLWDQHKRGQIELLFCHFLNFF